MGALPQGAAPDNSILVAAGPPATVQPPAPDTVLNPGPLLGTEWRGSAPDLSQVEEHTGDPWLRPEGASATTMRSASQR